MVLSECYEMSVEELEEDIMVTHEAMYGSIAILTCAFLKIVTRDRLQWLYFKLTVKYLTLIRTCPNC